jgi:hypothetical protein
MAGARRREEFPGVSWVGHLLVCRVGSFDLRKTQHVLVLGAGLILSVMLARGFGRIHGGL